MIIVDRYIFGIWGFKWRRGLVNKLDPIESMRRQRYGSRLRYNNSVPPPDGYCENGRSSRLIEFKECQVAKELQKPLIMPDYIEKTDFEGRENVRLCVGTIQSKSRFSRVLTIFSTPIRGSQDDDALRTICYVSVIITVCPGLDKRLRCLSNPRSYCVLIEEDLTSFTTEPPYERQRETNTRTNSCESAA